MHSLNINARRATPPELTATRSPAAAPSAADPAGFATLLRQNKAAPAPPPSASPPPASLHVPPPPVPKSQPQPQPPSVSPEPTRPARNDAQSVDGAPQASPNHDADAPDAAEPTEHAPGASPTSKRGPALSRSSRLPGLPGSPRPGTEAGRDRDTAKPTGDDAPRVDDKTQERATASPTGAASIDMLGWLAAREAATKSPRLPAEGELHSTPREGEGKASLTKGAEWPQPGIATAEAAVHDNAASRPWRGGDSSDKNEFGATLAQAQAVESIDRREAALQRRGETRRDDATAALQSAASMAPKFGDAAVPTAVTIAAPLATPAFADELGLRMSTLVEAGVERAELHLNPADLGPISVNITMDGTLATIDFGADLAATRHAIEAGLPALAGALQNAGFTLTGGGVSQHGGGDRGSRDDPRASGRAGARHTADDDAVQRVSTAARRVLTQGGIDLFA